MRHNHAGHIDMKIAVAELVQMKHIGLKLAYQGREELRRISKILLGFVHPLKAKSGGTIVEAMEKVHPGNLIGQGNLAEGDQRDPHSARDQARNQFASVGPGARQRIGSDQNVQSASGRASGGRDEAAPRESRSPILMRIGVNGATISSPRHLQSLA